MASAQGTDIQESKHLVSLKVLEVEGRDIAYMWFAMLDAKLGRECPGGWGGETVGTEADAYSH